MEWEGDGVMYRATVMGYNSTTRRHNLLYDDGDREKINLEEVAHRWLDARGMPEGISHPLTSHGPMAMDVGGSLLGQGLAVGGPGKRGGLGAVPSHYQPGAKGGAHVKNKGGYAVGGELDSMASLLQAVQVVQGPSDDLSLDFEPQVGGWAQQQQQQQQQVMTMKSPGRKGKQQNQGQFNSFLGHSQLPPGPSSGPSRRLKLDEALGFSLPPCPIPMFRTLPPPSSATGRAACTSPKLFGSSPPPAVSGASVSSSAALYRLQNHREEVGTLLFDQDSGLSQLIKDASSNQVPPQRKDVPHVNGMLGKVLNSQLLAAMPASSMNTVQLYRAYKFG